MDEPPGKLIYGRRLLSGNRVEVYVLATGHRSVVITDLYVTYKSQIRQRPSGTAVAKNPMLATTDAEHLSEIVGDRMFAPRLLMTGAPRAAREVVDDRATRLRSK
jgi:hypothetical protein